MASKTFQHEEELGPHMIALSCSNWAAVEGSKAVFVAAKYPPLKKLHAQRRQISNNYFCK